MSRIHEALKKAAEERAANAQPELPIEELGPGEASPAVPPGAPAEIGMAAPERRTAVATEAPFESLLANSPRRHWEPDAKFLLFSNGNTHARGAEEFRRLRSNLYHIRNKEEVRTILVTSAMPAEGKSFVTANLAQAFARQHERSALMIDADLRLPSLHQAFGTPASPGLTEYLRGEANVASILQRGPVDNLYLIPAGGTVSNPLELIGNGKLQQLLQELAPLFDWVVLDSAPILPVSDTGLVAELCDGVLLVVRAKSTAFDLVQKAKKELGERRLLGVVLNTVEPREAYGAYYYSGYYGTGYGAPDQPPARGAGNTKS
jgi:protein-tyrosine kinase